MEGCGQLSGDMDGELIVEYERFMEQKIMTILTDHPYPALFRSTLAKGEAAIFSCLFFS